MTAEPGADAAHTVDDAELARMREQMLQAEPHWPVESAELRRHLELLLPLVAGTVQGIAAEHALYEFTRQLDTWHQLADRYYAAFDKTISG
jgi:hypothetical protein